MKLLHFLFVIGIVGFSISCNKSESPKNAEAKLLTVTGSFGVGLIDTSAKTVIIKAPENMDITQIIPQFELSKNATIYPPSGVATDFSNPVTYTITSEDNTSKYVFKVTVLKPIVKFTIYDVSNWTPANFKVPQTNALIKIYTKTENIGADKIYDTLTTDQNAQAILYGLKSNDYYFTVAKDNKSNIINGYVLIGRYNTQEEADSSPDPNAKVGGLRFLDLNGDNRLNSYDKSNFQIIWSKYDLDINNVLLIDLFISN